MRLENTGKIALTALLAGLAIGTVRAPTDAAKAPGACLEKRLDFIASTTTLGAGWVVRAGQCGAEVDPLADQ